MEKGAKSSVIFWGVVILVVFLVLWNIKALLKGLIDSIFGSNTTAATTAWWKNLFGIAAPGTVIPDATGQAGNDISLASQAAATAAATPQLQYDLARSAYGKANGIAPLNVEGTSGWPWTSFDDWKSQGSPALPTP